MAIGKTELQQRVAESAGLNKAQAGRAVDAVLNTITEALSKGQEVNLTGFGSFRVAETSARQGRNPRTGAELKIPANRSVKCTAGKQLKDVVNKKKSKK